MRNKKNILVVDLDRSLIRSDMLYETFWSAFSINWRIFLRAFFLIFTSRLKLKDYLYRQSDVDVATLPYNKKVMAIIRARQAMGHKIVMATATHHQLAKKIASHLGLFDDVHGSDQTNLRGQHKADAILNAYPEASIEYIGDHTTDLQLWRKSDRAISVDAGPRLRRQIEDIGIAFEHLDTAPKTGLALIKSLRLYQWSKNALVFVPMIASHEFTLEVFLLSIMAFVSFGMIASCMYIFNDLCDLKSDRVHDRKKNRPFASGMARIDQGLFLGLGMSLSGLVLASFVSIQFFYCMLVYLSVALSCSVYLKRILIVDLLALACLYAIRIIGGGLAAEIMISFWLLVFSVFFFFSLATIKRMAELISLTQKSQQRVVGRDLHTSDIPVITHLATSSGFVSVLVFTLYLNSPEVKLLYSSPTFLGGICLVLAYWISRLAIVTQRGQMHDDPLIFALKDRISYICLTIILLLLVIGAWT